MFPELFKRKEFQSGVVIVAIGLLFLITAQNYSMGELRRMGPGYLPTALSIILIGLGVLILLGAWRKNAEETVVPGVRPIFILTLAVVLFGFTLEWLGLIVASVLAVTVTSLAGDRIRVVETAVLAGFLTLFMVVLFVEGLGMPFRLWPRL